jgi:tRNA uridine 5-carboxymethylaminomethyl modification enzyme
LKPEEINSILKKFDSEILKESEQLSKVLKRPKIELLEIVEKEPIKSTPFFLTLKSSCDDTLFFEIIEQINIELKYEGYVSRQEVEVERFYRFESIKIPKDIDYNGFRSISTEGKEKLIKVRPISIGQASRIVGVTPADISVLMVYLRN